jgi:osmotically-inducible protein OsmY
VCERLWHDPRLEVADVSVEVQDGVPTLEGTVPHRWMKYAIEDSAAACIGVNDVINRIRVVPQAKNELDSEFAAY